MTYGLNGTYADLGPTQEELAALAEVIDEVMAEELGGLPGDDDGAALANLYGASDRIDLAYAAEQQRQAEDGLPLPRRSEDRTEWLLSRASRGTYTPPTMYRAPLDMSQSSACDAHQDEFGRCGARFHDAGCVETVRSSAATGSAQAAESWVRTLANAPSSADVELARADLVSPDDLFGPDGPSDLDTLARARQLLGIGGRADLPARPAPSTAAQQLGIY
jgi:hypothetical protein